MGTPYAGRHRPALLPEGPAPARERHMSSRTVRRPLLSAGAALVLVGASVASYATAGDARAGDVRAGDVTSGTAATFIVPAAASSPASERVSDQLDQRARKRDAAAVAAQAVAAQAVAVQAAAAQAAAAQAAAAQAAAAQAAAVQAAAVQDAAVQDAELARLTVERQATADRVARDAQRQAVVASAQQDPRSVARSMLRDFGWNDSQWSCLEQLWAGESGWDYRAANASSDAYGIPQALPASKMGTVAADYRTNPVTQITWGMQYVKASYGSPCAALGSWKSRSPHWY